MSNALKKSVKVSAEMMQLMAVLITCRSQDHAQLKFLFELEKPDGLLPDTAKLPLPPPHVAGARGEVGAASRGARSLSRVVRHANGLGP
jgi:hypothetical protein